MGLSAAEDAGRTRGSLRRRCATRGQDPYCQRGTRRWSLKTALGCCPRTWEEPRRTAPKRAHGSLATYPPVCIFASTRTFTYSQFTLRVNYTHKLNTYTYKYTYKCTLHKRAHIHTCTHIHTCAHTYTTCKLHTHARAGYTCTRAR